MLNFIWPFFIIISFIYAILVGRLSEVNTSVFDSTKSAVDISISLLGTTCLWTGIMQIASNTKIVKHLSKLLNPIMKNFTASRSVTRSPEPLYYCPRDI